MKVAVSPSHTSRSSGCPPALNSRSQTTITSIEQTLTSPLQSVTEYMNSWMPMSAPVGVQQTVVVALGFGLESSGRAGVATAAAAPLVCAIVTVSGHAGLALEQQMFTSNSSRSQIRSWALFPAAA